jgi:hypothetical protein
MAIKVHGSQQRILTVVSHDLRLVGPAEPMLATCRQRIASPLQHSDMERRTVPDPDGMRQTGRILRPGGLHGLIERIPQEILAGFWLDSNEPIHVLGFQITLQLVGVNRLGTIDK